MVRDAPCTHNSAKLKIFNLPKHYPVVKVRPCGPGGLAAPGPAIRWSVSFQPTDQRSDGGSDTERRLDLRRAAVQHSAMRSSSLGRLAPVFSSLGFPMRRRQSVFLQLARGWWRRGDSNS
jgi:hypothetical protein